jgi:DNA-binding response OmpR family regulator
MRHAQAPIQSGAGPIEHNDATAPSPRERRITAKRSCLVVDDDTIVMRLVANMVRELGYQVDIAEDGSKAMRKASQQRYDIGLTDLEMPLINGFLLASRVKMNASDTRTVIMTGRCHAEVLGMMTPAIVDAWLFKPFNLDELSRVLEDLESPEEPLRSAAV